MNADILNRTGIILNFVGGLMLTPDLIGLEKLQKLETYVENFLKKAEYISFNNLLPLAEKLLKEFSPQFDIQMLKKRNLIIFFSISIIFLFIPSITDEFLPGLYSIHDLTSSSPPEWFIATVAFIGYVFIFSLASIIEPIDFRIIYRELHRTDRMITVLKICFFIFIFVPTYVFLLAIIFPLVATYPWRRRSLREEFHHTEKFLREEIPYLMILLSALVLTVLMLPLISPFIGTLGLSIVLIILFHEFLSRVVKEPEGGALKRLLTVGGILSFSGGTWLQFIATF